MTSTPERVLRVLADVAGTRSTEPQAKIDPATFRWLPLSYVDLMRGESGLRGTTSGDDGFPADKLTDRIFRTAQLIDDPGALRVGWLWVAGTHSGRQVFFPLASVAAKVPTLHGVKNLASRVLVAGDKWADVVATTEPELTDLVTDRDERRQLDDIPLGRRRDRTNSTAGDAPLDEREARSEAEHIAEIRDWAQRASAAAGYPAAGAQQTNRPLTELLSGPLTFVVGVGLYVQPQAAAPRSITTSGTLRQWADTNLAGTAFAHVYDSDQPAAPTPIAGEPAVSTLRLDPSQEAVVAASASRPLTVVSGPPGTGKSQTVVAIAHHHVRLGRSVLVAAPTDAAVSALVALIESTPGPDPIVFGNSTHRVDIANRLGEGGGRWFTDEEVQARQRTLATTQRERDHLTTSIATLLDTEAAAEGDPASILLARQAAPGFFDVDADLRTLVELRDTARTTRGWFARRRARRAAERLDAASRAIESHGVDRLSELLDIAIARRRAVTLEADGGLDLEAVWPGLVAADHAVRDHAGQALEAATHHDRRADRSSRRAINAVAGALRAGRTRRRDLLANVRGDQLLEALPLWVASIRDVDDLLPMTPGLFDIVIVDEASHLDQIGAAPALLRAQSAVVVGDPRQLRHVSFVSDDRMQAALSSHGLADAAIASQLDVRRQSAFDAAAAVAPVTMLAEHYRCAPHLIDFSAQRFYDGRVSVATRHPRNESDRRIHVIEIADGRRDEDGVNAAEVDEIVVKLRAEVRAASDAIAAGTTPRSVGVISPFRAQADAIEAAVIAELSLSDIAAIDLRVGTVHSFQGCQRDVVYVSIALDDDSPTGSRSFLSEETLFNVMVTRAKDEVHVLTSATRPDRGILADYLRHAEHPELSWPPVAPLSPWAERVRRELADVGIPHRASYPAGRHHIDLVVGTGDDAIGLICGVHPDGARAHIDRHLSLVRRGWTLLDVFESRWGDRLADLALELHARLP